MNRVIETPVYLFLGFLESGKTKFIQETLEDKRFDSGEKTLVLICEEGEEEYDPARFKVKNVTLRAIEKDALSTPFLEKIQRETGAERVIVEYNGMWLVDDFFQAMPEGWVVNQIMTFFEASSFLNYNANMRQLVYDKLQYTELVVFNRFREEIDKMALHKIVRAATRRAQIVYEYNIDRAEYDDIVDPLPFDLNAPVVKIEDRDFALFYQDFVEETKKYIGKTLSFRGMVAWDKRLPRTSFVLGRHVMTCCEADIAYRGIAVDFDGSLTLATREWVEVTGKVTIAYSAAYKKKGPVIKASEVTRCDPPEQPLATFY